MNGKDRKLSKKKGNHAKNLMLQENMMHPHQQRTTALIDSNGLL